MNRKLNKLFLILIILVLTALPAAAQAEGSISVSLNHQDQPQAAISIGLCQIAAMEGNTFCPTAPFADSGMDLTALINRPDAAFAEDLHRYIQKHSVPCVTAVSDAKGQVTFDALRKGIYLVICRSDQAYTFKPYLVFLPQTIGEEKIYAVQSAPKIESLPPISTPPSSPTPAPEADPSPSPAPDTGDHSNQTLWLALLGLSGAGLLLLISRKKR